MKKFSLVLGAGGAKGFIHIGVLKALEKAGILPDQIVGCSIGALIGGYYSLYPDYKRLEEMAKSITPIQVIDVDFLALFKSNLLAGKKVDTLMNSYFGDADMYDCHIPFSCVATSLDSGNEHILSSGKMSDNIRASISIPIIFPSKNIGEDNLSDGGLSNPLPINIARKNMPKSVILAIDCVGGYKRENYKFKLLDVTMNTFNMFACELTKRQIDDADILINHSQADVKMLSFDGDIAKKLIRRGEKLTNDILPELKKKIRHKIIDKTRYCVL